MNEFDKWWEENYMNVSADRTEAEDIYNLGVESQQAKIDELKKKYDAMYNAFIVADDYRKEWHESYMIVRNERDELQAMVNKSIQALEQSKPHMMRQYDAMQALSILKGNKDEN